MSHRLRVLLVLLAALAASVSAAFAANLGGMDAENLGAEVAVVASCDTDGVKVWYDGGYDADTGSPYLAALHVGEISDACDGQTLKVTVGDFSGNYVEGEALIDIEDEDWPIVVVPVSGTVVGQELLDIAIVISGGGE